MIDCLTRFIIHFRKKFASDTHLFNINLFTKLSDVFGVTLQCKKNKKTFCGFPWVETSTAGRVYDLCVYYITGAPEGSPKVVLCGFMVLWRSRESNLRPLVYKA